MCFSFPRHHRRIARTICGKFAHIAILSVHSLGVVFSKTGTTEIYTEFVNIPLLSGQTGKFFAFLAWYVETLVNACKIICYKKSGMFPACWVSRGESSPTTATRGKFSKRT